MFWVGLTFKRFEDVMIFCVFIFIFCLEPTVREQLDEDDFRHYHDIEVLSAWKVLVKYFLFYLVVKILQLVHEVSCFPEVL